MFLLLLNKISGKLKAGPHPPPSLVSQAVLNTGGHRVGGPSPRTHKHTHTFYSTDAKEQDGQLKPLSFHDLAMQGRNGMCVCVCVCVCVCTWAFVHVLMAMYVLA